MEGRAIARPNRPRPGRADPPRGGFNGGPSNCPAKPGATIRESPQTTGFNGGPSNCPAKQPPWCSVTAQLPCFNGGPSNCPAKPVVTDFVAVDRRASMEGRAIARPNARRARLTGCSRASFNGGPSNCPAKPDRTRTTPPAPSSLQWRAEQLPGQTRTRASNFPRHYRFNGGPSNCPAKPDKARIDKVLPDVLQWRAEQLPGQTGILGEFPERHHVASMEGRAIARPNITLLPRIVRTHYCFNGGPSNCPAKRASRQQYCPSHKHASMEGRAIARPNSIHDH